MNPGIYLTGWEVRFNGDPYYNKLNFRGDGDLLVFFEWPAISYRIPEHTLTKPVRGFIASQ